MLKAVAFDFRPALLPLLIASCFNLAHAAGPAANALPTGGQIAAGQGSISQAGNTMTVRQASQSLIANWQTFNIGSNAAVNFVQPSSSAVALNRVLSADPSQIYGSLTANGQVFLVNPSGVVFGPSARVDAAGIAASSLNLSDADFLAGRYRFSGGNGATVSNLGQIAAREGGFVALVGASVNNAGDIVAPSGQVALAAGGQVSLDLTGNGLIKVQVDAGNGARVDNSGLVAADGGRVWLTAKSAAPVLATAVNQTGVVRANTIASRNGEIWIEGTGGTAQIAGRIEAKGTQAGQSGGKIVATADQVTVSGTVDASGNAGGGQIYVGGGWQGKDATIAEAQTTTVTSTGRLVADATGAGNGGTVVNWSGQTTQMDGAISAKGAGQGSGGQVETSSRHNLGVGGTVDVSAASGQGGSWLLDPSNLRVGSSTDTETATGSPNFQTGTGDVSDATTSTVKASSIETVLNTGGNVNLTATDITIAESISKTSGGDSTLSFLASGNITLGSSTVSKAISSSVGKLNVNFGGSSSAGTTSTAGTTTLYGGVSTNGGAVVFYNDAVLSYATPISTKPIGVSSSAAGDIAFNKNVTLAAPGYSVSISAQGPQSGSSTYTGAGGNVNFKGDIITGTPALVPKSPQALTVDTTGSTAGSLTLGSTSANVVGSSLASPSAGPLRSLTLTGPTAVNLMASQMNFSNTSGTVLSMSTNQGVTPKLVLNAANTSIVLTGGTVTGLTTGYTDLVQDTFDVAVNTDAVNRTLLYQSDRSIKVQSHNIDGTAGTGKLDVTFKPFNAVGATGGAVIMDTASINSNGGNVNIGGAAPGTGSDYAVGYASDSITDGVSLKNTAITTGGGNLSIAAKAPLTSAAGTGVKLSGAATVLSTGAGNLSITGLVTVPTTAGNKDGVILGESGAARVTLQTTSGNISVLGDANSGGWSNPSGGSRYDGLIISSRAMIKSDSGNISLTGKGGGGDLVYISENHGIRLEDTQTTIASASGNITLTGTAGGKTTATQGDNSFGIYAKGNSMYIGSAPAAANDGTTAITATGVVTLQADSMQFVNSSSAHLNVGTSNELRLLPLSAGQAIELGTAGNLDKLYLSSGWFSGSNAVFTAGFGTGSGYGTAASGATGALTIGRSDGTGSLTVASAITLRDNTELLTGSGNVAINGPLTVQGAASAARTLTIETASGSVSAGGAITADSVQMRSAGSGDFVLSGTSLINNLAANIGGNLTVNNAQALIVGSASNERLGTVNATNGITTASGKQVALTATAGNLSITQDITIGTGSSGVASLSAGAGAVTETATAKIVANQLYVGALNDSRLNNDNLVGTLAANVDSQGLEFRNTAALDIGRVTVTPYTAASDGTATAGTAVNQDGITATSGRVALQLSAGDLTQSKDVAVSSLQLHLANGAATLGNTSNDIRTLSARLDGSGKALTGSTKSSLTVDTVSSTLIGSTNGITANAGNVTLAASADAASTAGDLVLNQKLDTGASSSLTSTTADLSSGKGAITENASTATALITADKLRLRAVNTSQLNNQNQVNVLATAVSGNSKGLDFTNGKALLVGTVGATAGLAIGASSARGNAYLNTGGATAAGATITQTAPIAAAGLLVRSRGGVTLTDVGNDVATLAVTTVNPDVAGYNVSYRDANDFAVGSLAPNAGGSATAGISAGSATVRLESVAGALTQAASSPITAQNLFLKTATGVTLDNATNDVTTLAGKVTGTGPFIYADLNAVTVDGGTDIAGAGLVGVQTANGLVRLSASKDASSAAGDLALNQDVSAGGTSAMTLEAGKGAVMELANVNLTADQLLVLAQNATTLENTVATGGKHLINTLAAAIGGTGSFSFRNDQALTVGSVGGTNGVSTASGDVKLATLTGSLTATQNVTAGANGNVDMRAGGSGDIALNGATVASTNGSGQGSGTVQWVAGGAITTNTANGATSEIGTAGNVLLQAAGSIGSDTNRIEMAGVGKLAADAGGDVWLRQTSGDLEVGSVTALNSGSSFGGTASNRSGIATANNGKLTLTSSAGNLTLTSNVAANGTGTVDLRTGSVSKSIAINGATVSSGSGQVQLIASGDISTNTATGSANEIATSGNVLLVAGGAIGADGQRIETSGVGTLAAESVGGQWLRQTSGNLTVGAVTAITPSANALDNAAVSKNGLVATGVNNGVSLFVSAGDLTVTRNVTANGSGAVDLRTAGSNKAIAISGATVGSTSGTLQLIASGDIATNTADGTTNELTTSGKVLLTAGGAIGASGQRIEIANAGQVATQSVGDQWLRQTAGAFTAGSGTPVQPSDDGIDVASATRTGLRSGGTIAVATTAGDITQNAGATIQATGLRLDATGGNVSLTDGGNAVTTLAANVATAGKSLSYVDVDGVSVDTVGGLSGVSTNNGLVAITASGSGDLGLAQNLSAGGGTVLLTAGGAVTGSGGAVLSPGGALKVVAANTSALTGSNNVSTLAANLTGSNADFSFTNANALQLGTVNGTTGIASNNGVVTLALTSGDLTQASGATVTGNSLKLALTDGNATLEEAGNSVTKLAANLNGAGKTLRYTNAGGFAVDTVAGTNGVATNGAVTLTAGGTGDLGLAQDLSAGGADVQLIAGGAVSGTGRVLSPGGGLRVAAANTSSLTGANNVGTVAAGITGNGAGFSFNNAADVVVGTVAGTSGISANGGPVSLATTAGGISAAGATIQAASLELDAAGSVALTGANTVATLAGRSTGGDLSYYNTGDLVIGSVGSRNGVSAGGAVWVRTGGDLRLTQAVTGLGSGANAVVLAATRGFYNTAGGSAVSAPNSRWLIYDDNPALEDRLGGLTYAFRRLHTLYDSYPPSSVTEAGNGYITTAMLPDPEQYARQAGGTTSATASGNTTTAAISAVPASGELAPTLLAVPAAWAPSMPRPAFSAPEPGQAQAPAVPLQLSLESGRRFTADLATFAMGGEFAGLAESLPSWIKVDPNTQRISGTAPAGSEELEFRVLVRVADRVQPVAVHLSVR